MFQEYGWPWEAPASRRLLCSSRPRQWRVLKCHSAWWWQKYFGANHRCNCDIYKFGRKTTKRLHMHWQNSSRLSSRSQPWLYKAAILFPLHSKGNRQASTDWHWVRISLGLFQKNIHPNSEEWKDYFDLPLCLNFQGLWPTPLPRRMFTMLCCSIYKSMHCWLTRGHI